MEKEPRLLVWNYTVEEKRNLDALLDEIKAPSAVAIETNQGHLSLREIIHTDGRSDREFASAEKVLLFYNIPQKGVLFLMGVFKQNNLPRPIYAVITEHSIEWPFSELHEHLVEERDRMEKRSAGKSRD